MTNSRLWELPRSRLNEIIAGRVRRLVVFPAYPVQPRRRPVSFGITLAQVAEVVPLSSLEPRPDTPSWFRGVTHWRDEEVPVIDLAHRLGLAETLVDGSGHLILMRPLPRVGRVAILPAGPTRLLRLPVPHTDCQRTLPIDAAQILAAVELFGETLVVPALDRVCQPLQR